TSRRAAPVRQAARGEQCSWSFFLSRVADDYLQHSPFESEVARLVCTSRAALLAAVRGSTRMACDLHSSGLFLTPEPIRRRCSMGNRTGALALAAAVSLAFGSSALAQQPAEPGSQSSSEAA